MNNSDSNDDGENVTWKDIKYQILASNVAFLSVIHQGVNLAFSNLLLDEFDTNTISWFASILGLSTPIGSFLCGPLMDKFGRKGTNLMTLIPCILSWFIMYYAASDQTILLYGARFLSGFAGGLSTASIVYVSEIGHRKYRTALLSLLGIHFSFGVLLTSVLQSFLAWRQSALFNAFFFICVFLLHLFCTPESPIWLANFRGKWTEAEQSLSWLISSHKVYASEWTHLHEMALSEKQLLTKSNMKNTFELKRPAVYKPMSILFVLLLLQQCTGIYVVVLYAIKIIAVISPRTGVLVKNEAFVLFGVVRLAGSVLGSILSLRLGRKTLLQLSSVGMQVAYLVLVATSATVEWRQSRNLGDTYEWIVISMFLLSTMAAAVGLMNIPWTLAVELLPHEARSIGSAVLTAFGSLLLFAFAKVFPFALDAVSVWCLFLFFAVASALTSVFTHASVPETYGKRFDEIEKHFE